MRESFRAAILGAALLVTVALLPVFTSGCGETASADPGSGTATPVTAAPVAAAGKTAATRSGMPSAALHDKVMAERSRLVATVTAVEEITSTPDAPPPESEAQPATTATSDATPSGAAPGGSPDNATEVVLTGGQTPLVGVWSGTADRLASFLLGLQPSPCFTVPTLTLAEYYVYYCADAGLRADVLWAQMIHETGYGAYGGDVWPEQNNYAGIGATGGGAAGMSFATAEVGVMAHVAHMVAYVYQSSPVSWADSNTDPRFDLVNPRGAAYVLADLNGRWAVPGTEYGERIEDVVRAINGG
ncbi:MAG: glucosaminidase domain-containing protein [Thermoleophilia bacterium]|nr:glucosaminidase domain-containing protein [Thermoleophilia bacterium]